MFIVAIDPGTTESAITVYGSNTGQWSAIWPNRKIADYLRARKYPDDTILIIEQIQHMGTGMPAGKSVFITVKWTGVFFAWWPLNTRYEISRPTVKANVCGTAQAKDKNIRQAMIDRYPPIGGGKTPQIGIKSNPGPLLGYHDDMWASLAVMETAKDFIKQGRLEEYRWTELD